MKIKKYLHRVLNEKLPHQESKHDKAKQERLVHDTFLLKIS
jgi:hypothetical protein